MSPIVLQRLWSALLGRLVRLHRSIRLDILQRLVKRFWSFFLTLVRRLFASKAPTYSRRGDEVPPNPPSTQSPPSLCADEEKLANTIVPVTSVVLASSVTPGQVAQPVSDMEMVARPATETTPNSQPNSTDATDSTPQSAANDVTQPGPNKNQAGPQLGPNNAGLQPFQLGNFFPIRPGEKTRWFAQPNT